MIKTAVIRLTNIFFNLKKVYGRIQYNLNLRNLKKNSLIMMSPVAYSITNFGTDITYRQTENEL